jgi:hypothetical protein
MGIALGDIGQVTWLKRMVVVLMLVTTVVHMTITNVYPTVANLLKDGNNIFSTSLIYLNEYIIIINCT